MLAPTVEVTILRAGEVASRAQLAQGVFVIGRVDGCDIWLPDTGISRRHAILHIDTEGVWVEDCGSGNGTWYRGTRVQRQVIGDGDELLIEPFHLRFHLLAESTAEQTLFHGNSTTQQAVREIARLVGMGRLSGQEFQLSPERPIVLGRASSCDIVLPEPIASREHAELVWEGGAWWIRDNHSSNGTFVNGQRQREVALQSGDRIRIGALDFRFILDNPDGPDQLPTRHVPYGSPSAPARSALGPALMLMGGLSVGCAGLLALWPAYHFLAPMFEKRAPAEDPRLAQARQALAAGQPEEAARLLQILLAEDPTSAEAQALAGKVAAALPVVAAEPPAATPAPRPRAPAPAPVPAPAPAPVAAPAPAPAPVAKSGASAEELASLSAQAEAAVAAGNPARGIQLWEQLVSLAPTSPEAAVASVRMEQVRRDGSSRSEAAWANAQKAIIAGDFVAARAQLKEVLRLDPLHKDAQATLDGVNTKLRADAEAAYKEARRLEDIEDRRGAVSGYRRVMTLVGDRNDALYKRAETRLADLN